MLRAVIEKDGKKVYFDFCDKCSKVTQAIRRIDKEKAIPDLMMNNDENSIRITKFKDEEFEKLASLIQPNDRVEDVFILSHRIKYDNEYKDYFLNHFNEYHSIHDVNQVYINFQAKEIKERNDIHPSIYPNPYSINYEVNKVIRQKGSFYTFKNRC